MAINWGSIMAKANAYMQTPAMQKEIQNEVDSVMLGLKQPKAGQHTPEEAAQKLITVIDDEIKSAGLSSGVADAISGYNYGSPIKLSPNRYLISVFTIGQSKQSLAPETYGSINDLALLYNDGVDHIMEPVYGYWHGQLVGSRTHIPATHFLENSRDNFVGNYASEYNIIECKLNR